LQLVVAISRIEEPEKIKVKVFVYMDQIKEEKKRKVNIYQSREVSPRQSIFFVPIMEGKKVLGRKILQKTKRKKSFEEG